MTPKQTRFAQEYLLDSNAKQAAIRAGYSAKGADVQGSKLLRLAKVQAIVRKAQTAARERLEVTQDWLIGEFEENHRLAREGNPVLDRYGNPTGGLMRQISASNKALESIAVITGYWVNKHKHGGDADNPMVVNVVIFTGAGTLIGPIIYYLFRPKNLPFGDARFSPRCANCGYSLIGNVSGLCPECGTKIEKV